MPKTPGIVYLFDVPAIKSWADADPQGNESKAVFAAVKAGSVIIFNRVWDSAKGAYTDECDQLPKDEFERKKCGEEHRLAAVMVADRLEATFPVRGGYDDAIEWMVVGIALNGGYTIVTDKRRKQKYEAIDGLSVITYTEMLDEL